MYRIHLRRSAFTLIELLVVIAIIAILSSLLLAGVMAFMRKGPEVLNRNDVLQLSTNLNRFYEKHKMYPPSKIRLCSNRATYTSKPTPASVDPSLDAVSLQALGTIWPNLPSNFTNLNWSGSGTGTDDYILEGDQCLVFFLGGIPTSNGLQGFSTIPTNPTDLTGDRVKWHDFPAARLKIRATASSPFPSFADAHNLMPFVYFSSGRRPDGYNPTHMIAGLNNVSPYAQQTAPTVKYYNSTTFQLISAGPDGIFGPGSTVTVTPTVTQTPWAPGGGNAATKDDISNFHDGKLGSS